MSNIERLTKDLPDAASARRFFDQLSEKHPTQAAKLSKNEGLLNDVLTLAAFSPLLSVTMIQNPEYLWWLNRKRFDTNVRNKEELLESLARFSMTNSQIEPQVLFARFRRRELLLIYLRDIRRLGTIAEITEEISNLADAILENALRIAKQEMDNRFGSPLETDANNRKKPADLCIVSLGKLGSKELNYSSDIDLLFLYSAEGMTSGSGTRGQTTNREYFSKLAEMITKLVGQMTGEGAAYRVDLRLRPYGRIGGLALSVKDTVRYYTTEARSWERQVLIRSRASAGKASIFNRFFSKVEALVFSPDETIEKALRNVRQSKEKIDYEHRADVKFDVKLGSGGIREIEFIAQALQLAHGGKDRWLRSPHTLISLSRLADRQLISESELTKLSDGYDFLRHLEHVLQMENGLQTHSVPNEPEKRLLVAKRMGFSSLRRFDKALSQHSGSVHSIFSRIFSDKSTYEKAVGHISETPESKAENVPANENAVPTVFRLAFEKSGIKLDLSPANTQIIEKLAGTSPKFVAMITANPSLVNDLPDISKVIPAEDYLTAFEPKTDTSFGEQMSALRRSCSRSMLEIAVFDLFGKLSLRQVKDRQTELAEASIETALKITRREIALKLSVDITETPLAVLALGKLGSGGIDYDSDLDLVLVYDENTVSPAAGLSHYEFYNRFVEIFVGVISNMTRDGSLYRVDLRLRPHGKNGPNAISKNAFLDYMNRDAAIWELLAYVKIRAVGGDIELARNTEISIRSIIHERAAAIEVDELRSETVRLRGRLEDEKANSRNSKDIDIKFGAGGMLDIYFAIRFLQLRDNVPDDNENRSTDRSLAALLANNSLSADDHESLLAGYDFLSALDHELRLATGRSTRLPRSNQNTIRIVAERMQTGSPEGLMQQLTIHRLNIRSAYENIMGI